IFEGHPATRGSRSIALEHEELVVVHGRHVTDVRALGFEQIEPVPAGEARGLDVELVDAQILADRPVDAVVTGYRALEQRVERVALRVDRHALETARRTEVRRVRPEIGVLRGADQRVRRRGPGRHDVRSGNFAAQHLATRARIDEKRSELLAEPQAPETILAYRFDIEVRARQQLPR